MAVDDVWSYMLVARQGHAASDSRAATVEAVARSIYEGSTDFSSHMHRQ